MYVYVCGLDVFSSHDLHIFLHYYSVCSQISMTLVFNESPCPLSSLIQTFVPVWVYAYVLDATHATNECYTSATDLLCNLGSSLGLERDSRS